MERPATHIIGYCVSRAVVSPIERHDTRYGYSREQRSTLRAALYSRVEYFRATKPKCSIFERKQTLLCSVCGYESSCVRVLQCRPCGAAFAYADGNEFGTREWRPESGTRVCQHVKAPRARRFDSESQLSRPSGAPASASAVAGFQAHASDKRIRVALIAPSARTRLMSEAAGCCCSTARCRRQLRSDQSCSVA